MTFPCASRRVCASERVVDTTSCIVVVACEVSGRAGVSIRSVALAAGPSVSFVAASAAYTGVRSTIGTAFADRRPTSAGGTNSVLQTKYPPPIATPMTAISASAIPAMRAAPGPRGKFGGSRVPIMVDADSPASDRSCLDGRT